MPIINYSFLHTITHMVQSICMYSLFDVVNTVSKNVLQAIRRIKKYMFGNVGISPGICYSSSYLTAAIPL
jgi:hypothetical protein